MINLAGEVIELEVEIDAADLPAAVKAAISARYPTGEITEAETLELGLSHSLTVQRKFRTENAMVLPKYPSDGLPTRPARA